ncbi:MAG: BamA/TamA family outer membrane protein [Chlamydiae bacterium]|nr:BamA/TamA family outer membrane protein [Chlamydiota bacterium]
MKKFFVLFLFTPFLLFGAIDYNVQFVGIENNLILKGFCDVSDLVHLKDKPPRSLTALKYRGDNDIEKLLKVLHVFGYWDSKITIDIEEINGQVTVFVLVSPGPRYVYKDVKIFKAPCNDNPEEVKQALNVCPIEASNLGIVLDKPALSFEILRAENLLLSNLANCGYPFSKIEKKNIDVDFAEKGVFLNFCVDPGPLAKFGSTTVKGLKQVDSKYFEKRIKWEEGEVFSLDKLDKTKKKLLNSNLFSSVAIVTPTTLDPNEELPITIKVVEAFHKTFSIGASYATVDGPGVNFGWENRNFRGLGDVFNLDVEVCAKLILGAATFKKPDFLREGQNFILRFEAFRINIFPYLAYTTSAIAKLDRQIDPDTFFSLGINGEYINVQESANNGTYTLIGLPIFVKHSTAKDLLNPSQGYTITYLAAPDANVINNNSFFFTQKIIGEFYQSMGDNALVMAWRIQLGSIVGASIKNIPLTKVFLGGSDEDLRGYRYRTVGPLDQNRDIIGGRSAIFGNYEMRFRVSKKIGLVPFFDIGAVSLNEYPTVTERWFKSVGIGLRYFTFFGPLRLDAAIPLDRRKSIDPAFKLYASIGQSF